MPGSITVDARAVLEEKNIGIMDLGSNSLRLMIARIKPDGSYAVLNQVKQMVRLGEGAFQHGRLREESMTRTLAVLRGMASMCDVYGASETIAVATAAVRDAANGEDFLARVRDKTGITFTAVSGQEEARLIYLGVSSGLEHTDALRLFIDIGGGSTELIVGSSDECRNLDSMKLGCVRLSNLFFDDGEKPVPPRRYAALQSYIRNSALHSFQRIADFTLTEAVGSSGTAQNLAEISAALDEADALRQGRKPVERRDLLSYAGLCRVVRELCSRTLKERRALPGINANRADVIIAGAAILQTIMEDQGFDSVRISNRNLQNGLLVDYITRRQPHKEGCFHPVRKDSVLHLARKCGYEERHSRHVARLALDLFDSSRALGLHTLSPNLREILHYAGLLHDIGIFISFSRHNLHSHYLIRNTELLGFTAREVELLAALAYFHRKRPTRKTPFYTDLDEDMRAEVRPLSLFLLLAERMDKSHRQIIRTARFLQNKDNLLLRVSADDDCPIEMEQLRHSLKNIRKVFDTREITLERFNFEKGETRGDGTAPPGQK